MAAQYRIERGVAVITLDNPPLNGLNLATREALMAALGRAEDDPEVGAIVLAGAARGFCSGADIAELGQALATRAPNLPDLIAALESCTKPVVAALHGVVMGGGLELAMGCHYRVAAADAAVALPEVNLGLIPGAGGTQRLPRALGVEAALNLIVGGKTVAAARLAEVPGQVLLQRVVEPGQELSAALALAREAAEAAPPEDHPRLRDLPCGHLAAEAYFQFVRNALDAAKPRHAAPLQAIDCLQAATRLPVAAGLQAEQRAFLRLMHSPESAGLRHAFLARRAAARVPGLPSDTPCRTVGRVAVLGAGTMGTGIAISFLDAGLSVRWFDTSAEALERGGAAIRRHYDGQVAKGRLTAETREQRLALLGTTMALDDLADHDLVIEAVFEDMAVKQKVFRQLDRCLKSGAILASNTSTLDLDRIAAVTRRPQDVIGLHFFSPAQIMPLLEVVRGAATAPDVLATALALGRRIGKTCVVAGVCDGFIGNRMLESYLRQAGFLLDEGCSPQQIDEAIERFGFAMGPFRMSDMAGNDVAHAIRQRRRAERPELRFSPSGDLLYELGRHGQKAGAGWYDYAPGARAAKPSAEVAAMLDAHRRAAGIAPRVIGDDEIVQRLMLALVNEGAGVLEDGIASRAGDIDVVYLTGYGFPAWRGGPMFWADQAGLYNVVAAMRRFARNPLADPSSWRPSPLLERLAAEGGRLTG
ncbi:MAG: 3-hydroxyacyl-CoA dehydrogenase NAD-binding domain-containing protein [Pigmentiphaga sp.]|nr:3-hydroxyacyl-CoA dehydrogenase NAD-binding domain-containing protein [Pigmentiphaga sp.]